MPGSRDALGVGYDNNPLEESLIEYTKTFLSCPL